MVVDKIGQMMVTNVELYIRLPQLKLPMENNFSMQLINHLDTVIADKLELLCLKNAELWLIKTLLLLAHR
jgi:hypothetical protein